MGQPLPWIHETKDDFGDQYARAVEISNFLLSEQLISKSKVLFTNFNNRFS
jgi:hypothetical protein